MVYTEKLATQVARILVGGRYNEDYDYYLIIDNHGTYVSCVNPETGEKVSLVEDKEDDLLLECLHPTDEIDLNAEEVMDEYVYKEVASKPHWTPFFLVMGIVVMCGIGGILWASGLIPMELFSLPK